MDQQKDGWLVVLCLTALSDSISVYIGPSLREGERKERGEKKCPNNPNLHLLQAQLRDAQTWTKDYISVPLGEITTDSLILSFGNCRILC